MSDFKKIQSEITSFRNDIENKKASDARLAKQRIERDIFIMEESGVGKLFEEIRDSGLVKTRLKTADELKHKKIFFGSHEDKLDYIPVKIEISTPDVDGIVCIQLRFNAHPSPLKDVDEYGRMNSWWRWGHNYVGFSVIKNELCLTPL